MLAGTRVIATGVSMQVNLHSCTYKQLYIHMSVYIGTFILVLLVPYGVGSPETRNRKWA